jgi:hypothetical protein
MCVLLGVNVLQSAERMQIMAAHIEMSIREQVNCAMGNALFDILSAECSLHSDCKNIEKRMTLPHHKSISCLNYGNFKIVFFLYALL